MYSATNWFRYLLKQTYKEFFSVSIRIPEYAYYQKLYAVAYVILGEEVIYSNKVCSSFAELANLDKVVFKETIHSIIKCKVLKNGNKRNYYSYITRD